MWPLNVRPQSIQTPKYFTKRFQAIGLPSRERGAGGFPPEEGDRLRLLCVHLLRLLRELVPMTNVGMSIDVSTDREAIEILHSAVPIWDFGI